MLMSYCVALSQLKSSMTRSQCSMTVSMTFIAAAAFPPNVAAKVVGHVVPIRPDDVRQQQPPLQRFARIGWPQMDVPTLSATQR